ncbi:hypothetical protein OsI_22975 [Oryza sativa Indica Group]|uniref:Uncharacterized protein n=1 Tax=Oryza sativa subsp. indica TaxID=39946 RepID=B8B2F5_ORYSI|nr:hypothetical protein OsI_22975 [Oryza sativa Indica Group]
MAAAVDGAVQQRRRAPPTAKGGGVQATGGRLNHHPLPPLLEVCCPGLSSGRGRIGMWLLVQRKLRSGVSATRRSAGGGGGDEEERRRGGSDRPRCPPLERLTASSSVRRNRSQPIPSRRCRRVRAT